MTISSPSASHTRPSAPLPRPSAPSDSTEPTRTVPLSARDESGMTTAEYAVGTVGACSVGGLLVKVAQSDWFNDLIREVFQGITGILPF